MPPKSVPLEKLLFLLLLYYRLFTVCLPAFSTSYFDLKRRMYVLWILDCTRQSTYSDFFTGLLKTCQNFT